jgi:hypothetical protein
MRIAGSASLDGFESAGGTIIYTMEKSLRNRVADRDHLEVAACFSRIKVLKSLAPGPGMAHATVRNARGAPDPRRPGSGGVRGTAARARAHTVPYARTYIDTRRRRTIRAREQGSMHSHALAGRPERAGWAWTAAGGGSAMMLLSLLLITASPHVATADLPVGGGACTTARDCQLAGECKNSKCVCDPGWAVSLSGGFLCRHCRH